MIANIFFIDLFFKINWSYNFERVCNKFHWNKFTAFQTNYYPDRFVDKVVDEPSAKRRGIRRLFETWKVIDDQIGGNEWVLGECFSAVDIYLFMLTTWLKKSRGHPITDQFPNVKRIADVVISRQSVKLVFSEWIAWNIS